MSPADLIATVATLGVSLVSALGLLIKKQASSEDGSRSEISMRLKALRWVLLLAIALALSAIAAVQIYRN